MNERKRAHLTIYDNNNNNIITCVRVYIIIYYTFYNNTPRPRRYDFYTDDAIYYYILYLYPKSMGVRFYCAGVRDGNIIGKYKKKKNIIRYIPRGTLGLYIYFVCVNGKPAGNADTHVAYWILLYSYTIYTSYNTIIYNAE